MTQLRLGPLAFKYPKNMPVLIFLSVLIEYTSFAGELKCFMYKLNEGLKRLFSVKAFSN